MGSKWTPYVRKGNDEKSKETSMDPLIRKYVKMNAIPQQEAHGFSTSPQGDAIPTNLGTVKSQPRAWTLQQKEMSVKPPNSHI
jgi:hypothetical protein